MNRGAIPARVGILRSAATKDLSRLLCVLRFFSVFSVLNLLPFSESRYSAIHPETPQCGIEGYVLCVSAVRLPYFTTSVKKLFKVCVGPPFKELVNDKL